MLMQKWVILEKGKLLNNIYDSYEEARAAAGYIHDCGVDVEIADVVVDVKSVSKPEFKKRIGGLEK